MQKGVWNIQERIYKAAWAPLNEVSREGGGGDFFLWPPPPHTSGAHPHQSGAPPPLHRSSPHTPGGLPGTSLPPSCLSLLPTQAASASAPLSSGKVRRPVLSIFLFWVHCWVRFFIGGCIYIVEKALKEREKAVEKKEMALGEREKAVEKKDAMHISTLLYSNTNESTFVCTII